jgi:glycosyltransferase involved in cell wall biosynthesis
MKNIPIKVVHVIVDLDVGGAEIMLAKLAQEIRQGTFELEIISLSSDGALADEFRSAGISIRALNMGKRLRDIFKIFTLIRWIKEFEPEIVHTWMYHADLLGGMAAKFTGSIPIIWSIRHSDFASNTKLSTRGIRRILGLISPWVPTKIISNSHQARDVHAQIGYVYEKMIVIPNGFDLEIWRANSVARDSVRKELGLVSEVFLIGLVARYHPQKDHRTFMRAAGSIAAKYPNVHFVLCGLNVDHENQLLLSLIDATNHKERFHLLGRRSDIPRLTASFDIATSSSSYGEAFPTTLGEAMACEVPCVTTNVGDAAQIVADHGIIVPAKNAEALAAAWEKIYLLGVDERQKLGQASREHIRTNYSLDQVVSSYENLYTQILNE